MDVQFAVEVKIQDHSSHGTLSNFARWRKAPTLINQMFWYTLEEVGEG